MWEADQAFARAGEFSTDVEIRRAIAIGSLTELLVSGMVDIGAEDRDGFHPWPVSTADAVIRMVSTWLELGRSEPWGGQVGWLRNTEAGNARARVVRERAE